MLTLRFIIIILDMRAFHMSLISRFTTQYKRYGIHDLQLIHGEYDDEFIKLFTYRSEPYGVEITSKVRESDLEPINRFKYRPTISSILFSNLHETTNMKIMSYTQPEIKDSNNVLQHKGKDKDDTDLHDFRKYLRCTLDEYQNKRLINVNITQIAPEITIYSKFRPQNAHVLQQNNKFGKISNVDVNVLIDYNFEPYKSVKNSKEEINFAGIDENRPTVNLESTIESVPQKTWKPYFPKTTLRKFTSIDKNSLTTHTAVKPAFLYFTTTIKSGLYDYEIFHKKHAPTEINTKTDSTLLYFIDSNKRTTNEYETIVPKPRLPFRKLKVVKIMSKSEKFKPFYKFIILEEHKMTFGFTFTTTYIHSTSIASTTTFKSTTNAVPVTNSTKKPITKKCYTCGLNDTNLGTTLCHEIFESPIVRAKRNLFKSVCSGETFIGGCFKRFLDVGKQYNERGCRHFPPLAGKSIVSKKFLTLEYMLQGTTDDCISSPYASLTPFSRSTSLYARYTVCVCSKKYCNNTKLMQSFKSLFIMLAFLSKILL